MTNVAPNGSIEVKMGLVSLNISQPDPQHESDGGRIKSFLSKYNGKIVRVIQHEGDNTIPEQNAKTSSTVNNFNIFLNNICPSPVAVDFIGVGFCDNEELFKNHRFFVVENEITLAERLETRDVKEFIKPIIRDIILAFQLLVKHKFSLTELKSSDIIIVERSIGQFGAKLSALETLKFYGKSEDLRIKIPAEYNEGSCYSDMASNLELQNCEVFYKILTVIPISKHAQSAVLQGHLITSLRANSWLSEYLDVHLFFWDYLRIYGFFSTLNEWMIKDKVMRNNFNNQHGSSIFPNLQWTLQITDLKIKNICEENLLSREEKGFSRLKQAKLIDDRSRRAASLVRLIRNLWEHSVKINFKQKPMLVILTTLDAFLDCFGETFPRLLLELYKFATHFATTPVEQKQTLDSFLQPVII